MRVDQKEKTVTDQMRDDSSKNRSSDRGRGSEDGDRFQGCFLPPAGDVEFGEVSEKGCRGKWLGGLEHCITGWIRHGFH